MPSATDLRRQAARCLRVAAMTDDPAFAATLVALAADFSDRADEVDPSLRQGDTGAAGVAKVVFLGS
jgi:hypothetical protein